MIDQSLYEEVTLPPSAAHLCIQLCSRVRRDPLGTFHPPRCAEQALEHFYIGLPDVISHFQILLYELSRT